MKKQLHRHKQRGKKPNQVAILLKAQLSILIDELMIHNEIGKLD